VALTFGDRVETLDPGVDLVLVVGGLEHYMQKDVFT